MERRAGNEWPLRNATVLLAEDELLIALDLESILQDAGANVIGPCPTLKSALKTASEEALSLAILDVRLGRETTQQVAEILVGRGIPFLFYTGQALPDSIRSIAGDAPILAKPADQKLLVETIMQLLQRHPVQTRLAASW
jgi:DNA-binding response OmpR family regulator